MAKLTSNPSSGHRLDVELADRPYPILINEGLTQSAGPLIRDTLPKAKHAVVISDSALGGLVAGVANSLEAANFRLTRITVPSGETSKSVQQVERLWTDMLADFTDRGSIVVAIGGGVVGDLAGFAAASFARGIPLIQIPTTLLSQVDSSVGGKTGINLPGTKNIVGAFWQPRLVMIDPLTLSTLPQREYASGLAEVAKYGVIMAPDLFSYLEENVESARNKDIGTINHLVAKSCLCKAEVVEEDERETSGRRAILNYGHTFGHAIEAEAGYGTLLHGEAVSIGMNMAAELARLLGRVDEAFCRRQRDLLRGLSLPICADGYDAQVLWEKMQHDKKMQHGSLHFVLPSRIGHVELVAGVEKAHVLDAIAACSS
ncbi:MAG TPA: 3-dehydroquinate synthase [Planctomycetaceae bacterium]|nr:3-dehydroquinate synthase [Planctomycetaceae bacterium]